jgi:thymidine kinase
MAKLHFFYSVMNAGKSTYLLQSAHNYESNGWKVYLFTSATDDRGGVGFVSSRVGLRREAIALSPDDYFVKHLSMFDWDKSVIFVDEIQFFTDKQVEELADIVDYFKIPVLTFGLKNNSNGELFGPAIIRLLALSDQIKEIKTVCHCGSKATQILRRNENGEPVITSDVVEVGDSSYESVCRRHWKDACPIVEEISERKL